jgi:hypothetical protein
MGAITPETSHAHAGQTVTGGGTRPDTLSIRYGEMLLQETAHISPHRSHDKSVSGRLQFAIFSLQAKYGVGADAPSHYFSIMEYAIGKVRRTDSSVEAFCVAVKHADWAARLDTAARLNFTSAEIESLRTEES